MILTKYTITQHKSFDELNTVAFKALIEDAFGKRLSSDYFSYAKPVMIYVAQTDGSNKIGKQGRYIGAIVVEQVKPGVYYLDKIAVAKAFQGKGIAKKLWSKLAKKKLVWRAYIKNPINEFYLKSCDGLQKLGKWRIYWRGLYPDELFAGVDYAMQKKKTLN